MLLAITDINRLTAIFNFNFKHKTSEKIQHIFKRIIFFPLMPINKYISLLYISRERERERERNGLSVCVYMIDI